MGTALITGTTSGFGTVITEHLIKKGFELIIFARSQEKLDTLINRLKASHEEAKLHPVLCNLSSLKSIEKACNEVKEKFEQIDLLVLNAGLWNFKFIETEDGIEEILQANLIAPVMIIERLKGLLPKTPETKVILTSSGLHQGTINFDDIEFRKKYSGFKSYRQSKLGVILMTRLYAQDPALEGVSFYCVHPGVVNTDLGRNANWFSRTMFKFIGTSLEKGASTHLYLIDTPASALTSGEYYANRRQTKATNASRDMGAAKRLFEIVMGYFASKQ